MAWKQLPTTSRKTLDLWRMDDHAYSPTDTTIGHMFALCDSLTVFGGEIPPELEYRPSPVLTLASVEKSWPDSEYYERLNDGTLDSDEATRALRVLHRYLRFVRMIHGEDS